MIHADKLIELEDRVYAEQNIHTAYQLREALKHALFMVDGCIERLESEPTQTEGEG